MNSKINELIPIFILILCGAGTYFPYQSKLNSGKTSKFDVLVGWLMFTAILLLLGIFALGLYSRISEFAQYFVSGSLLGISSSVNQTPHKDRVLPKPYTYAKWVSILGLV